MQRRRRPVDQCDVRPDRSRAAAGEASAHLPATRNAAAPRPLRARMEPALDAPAAVPPADPRGQALGIACAVASAFGYAAKAIVAKLTYGYGVPVDTVVVLRLGLALPLFALLWLAARRGPRLSARDHGRVALLGAVGFYGSTWLDFAGLAYVTAGLERLVLFLNPTFVLLIAALVLRRPIMRRQWTALGISYAGIVLVFAHDARHGGADVQKGGALVLASALLYAAYLTASAELARRLGALGLTVRVALWACGVALVHYALTHPLGVLLTVPRPVLMLSLINAVFCFVVPMLLLGVALARVGAPLAAQAGLVGPVATLALGAVVLGEPVTVWSAAGAALVVAGVVLLSTSRAAEKDRGQAWPTGRRGAYLDLSRFPAMVRFGRLYVFDRQDVRMMEG